MANFNLADYETVEERIKRLYDNHPDARIITKNLTTLQDRQVSTWVVQAEIWLPISDYKFIADAAPFEGGIDSPNDLWVLKATGMAFEIDGSGMANKTSALENCETSAIGRALANMNLSGNRRTSREEMAKVERGITPAPAIANPADDLRVIEVADLIQMATNKDELRAIWSQNAPILDRTVELSTGKHSLKSLIMARQAEVN